MIAVQGMTLQYPSGKGVFNLDFTIGEGEVAGYLGPNGAGKTTTIRTLMGFMKPDGGRCTIGGKDCWNDAPSIMRTLGYIPGEIAFIEGMVGHEYLSFIGDMRGDRSTARQKQLCDRFEFDPKGSIKKFSKGMKQKLGIIAAFMHDPDVLILDEPTSGLDPLMQNRFVELVLEEKRKGKTILMSSHMFEEIERTCNNVLIIKDGKLVAKSDIVTLKGSQRKGYIVQCTDIAGLVNTLRSAKLQASLLPDGGVEVYVMGGEIDVFTKALARFTVTALDGKAQTLEDVFMHHYSKGGQS